MVVASSGIAVEPHRVDALVEAVERGGAQVVPPADAAAILWTSPGDVDALQSVLAAHHRWVALPIAGVERWLAHGVIDTGRTWTCAKGVYAPGVAEHAVALLLAGARRLAATARLRSWEAPVGRRLAGTTTTIVGTGGIGRHLARLLAPFDTQLVGVNRSGASVDGFARTVAVSALDTELSATDFLVLACALTPETERIVDDDALARLPDDAWVVNVSRGALVDTAALVRHLDAGTIGGAALDVTDPEPLPQDHPLWQHDDVLITPHVANPNSGVPWSSHLPELTAHVERNVRAFLAGEPLEGRVDPHAGY